MMNLRGFFPVLLVGIALTAACGGKEEAPVEEQREVKEQPAAAVPALEPEAVASTAPGVEFLLFRGTFASAEDLRRGKPQGSGTLPFPSFPAEVASLKDPFATRYNSYLEVPQEGSWTLHATTSGTATIALHTEPVGSAPVNLKAGLHPVTISFIKGAGEPSLTLEWEGPETPRGKIPESAWKRAQ